MAKRKRYVVVSEPGRGVCILDTVENRKVTDSYSPPDFWRQRLRCRAAGMNAVERRPELAETWPHLVPRGD